MSFPYYHSLAGTCAGIDDALLYLSSASMRGLAQAPRGRFHDFAADARQAISLIRDFFFILLPLTRASDCRYDGSQPTRSRAREVLYGFALSRRYRMRGAGAKKVMRLVFYFARFKQSYVFTTRECIMDTGVVTTAAARLS